MRVIKFNDSNDVELLNSHLPFPFKCFFKGYKNGIPVAEIYNVEAITDATNELIKKGDHIVINSRIKEGYMVFSDREFNEILTKHINKINGAKYVI